MTAILSGGLLGDFAEPSTWSSLLDALGTEQAWVLDSIEHSPRIPAELKALAQRESRRRCAHARPHSPL